ncbi:hypothetical protein ABIB85_007660 [Bradyrhizobium sp. JR1.5]
MEALWIVNGCLNARAACPHVKHRGHEEHIGSSRRSARRSGDGLKLPFVDWELVDLGDQYGFGRGQSFSAVRGGQHLRGDEPSKGGTLASLPRRTDGTAYERLTS